MFENSEVQAHLCQFPTELIIYIFKLLSAKNLVACRSVCKRWKATIDDMTTDNVMWEKHCERDFKTLYKDAKMKSNPSLLWFDIYRSLSLWGRLSEATEVRDEFCHSSVSSQEIQDMYVLRNGVISVQKRESVIYYDISTLELSERNTLRGEFTKVFELDDFLIVLGYQLHLQLIKKERQLEDGTVVKKEQAVYRDIRLFRMFGHTIYFINFDNRVFRCNLDEGLKATELPFDYRDIILTVSLYNGLVHLVTAERNIYVFENNKFVRLFGILDVKDKIFDFIWRYEFMNTMSWQLFYLWVPNLRIFIPDGPLKYIYMMKVYGDVIFVGCKNGVVQIYYKPFTDGQLDLYNHKPIKEYRFAEREDIPVLSLHPILNIEIIEFEKGHKMLIAMPKKLIIMTYTHNFEVVTSKAVIPYVPPENVGTTSAK